MADTPIADEFDTSDLENQLAASLADGANLGSQQPPPATEKGTPVYTPTPSTPAPAPETQTPTQPPAPGLQQEQQQQQPNPQQDDKGEDGALRVRLYGKDAAYAALIKAGTPPREAFAKAYGQEESGQQPTQQQQEQQPDPNSLAGLKAQLAEVQKQRTELAENGSVITTETLALDDRYHDLRTQIREAEAAERTRAQQAEAAAQSQFDSEWAKADAEAIALYPDASVADSALNKAVKADMDAIMADENHPLRGISNLPMVLYPAHAARLGIAPKTIKAATPPAREIPTMMPASGGLKSPPPAVQNDATQQRALQDRVQAAIDSDDADAIANIFGEQLGGDNFRRSQMMLSTAG